MDFDKIWDNTLKNTEIIRTRVQPLMSLSHTHVPYIFLTESSVNVGDTLVRKGEVVVQKPSIIIPPNHPQFYGFEFEKDNDFNESSMINFLIVRGVTMPSFRYDNKTNSLDIFEGKLSSAIKYYQELLQQQENVHTGLLTGPEDYWQFSVLIFICSQIVKNADTDVKRLLEEYKKKHKKEDL